MSKLKFVVYVKVRSRSDMTKGIDRDRKKITKTLIVPQDLAFVAVAARWLDNELEDWMARNVSISKSELTSEKIMILILICKTIFSEKSTPL